MATYDTQTRYPNKVSYTTYQRKNKADLVAGLYKIYYMTRAAGLQLFAVI